jgi:hypothetical protein
LRFFTSTGLENGQTNAMFFLCNKSLTILRQNFNCSVMRFFGRFVDGSLEKLLSYLIRFNVPIAPLVRFVAASSSKSLFRLEFDADESRLESNAVFGTDGCSPDNLGDID